MSDKNNLYTKEDSYKSLDTVNSWISNVDNKISFILAFVGVFIGFIISKGTPNIFNEIADMQVKSLTYLNLGQVLSLLLIIIIYISSVSCLILLLIALLGRISGKTYKEYKLKTNSVLFFGSISSKNYAEYKKNLKEIKDEELLGDINSQIYINSKICNLKFKLYNYSVKILIVSLLVFCICELFNIL